MSGRGFDTIGVGGAMLGIMFGISCGPVTNLWQERYYERRIAHSQGRNIPEARVQLGKAASISMPCPRHGSVDANEVIVQSILSAFFGSSGPPLTIYTGSR